MHTQRLRVTKAGPDNFIMLTYTLRKNDVILLSFHEWLKLPEKIKTDLEILKKEKKIKINYEQDNMKTNIIFLEDYTFKLRPFKS